MTSFYPVLNTPTTAYTVQNGCGFIDSAYYEARGAVHNACDWNAVTGRDTDLGDPVHAADTGTVVNAGWDGYIGGMVELQHNDGTISGYWHLRDIHVKRGEAVQGGDLIGQIGKGARLSMDAHLHFYVKKAGVKLPLSYWPSTHMKNRAECEAFVRQNYHHPEEWLKARGAKRRIEDLQALRGSPMHTLVNGQDVTGTLAQYPAQGVTVDARTSKTEIYINGLVAVDLPALPLK
ncbi:M23 family metallopeptidase [Deinococcus frigens]|uniref:M23 family metallopeptidase n=1 Tax=Deinococcus frigens TaxID=249403 RepID=UPI0004983DAB|nr:M23 family metallopeptidase [Deinococcus frigens]